MKIKIIGMLICALFILPTASAITNENEEKDRILTNFKIDIIDMINQVNQSLIHYYIKGLVDIGSRYTGTDNCKKAAQYIFDEFKKIGLDVKIKPWGYVRYQCQNVVATLNGSDPDSDAVIVLCAHYDTITYKTYLKESVGANDDGSGIAALLAIANILSQYPPKHTIRFVADSGEEVGGYGTYDYTKNAYNRTENIIVSLIIDTIGYSDSVVDGKYINMFTPDRTKWLIPICENISETYRKYVPIQPKPLPHAPCDTQSFLDFGYDTCHIGQSSFPPVYIHSPKDTIDNINFSYLTNATKFVLAVTAELGNRPIDLQVRITRPHENSLYVLNHKLITKPGTFNIWRLGRRGLTYIFITATVEINITTNEEILFVAYSIDGDLIPFSNQTPPYEFKIKGFYKSILGKRTLGVHVVTRNGTTAYDEMDLFIAKLNWNLWKLWPQKERWI
jgi:putative aminopeptidase FrvX